MKSSQSLVRDVFEAQALVKHRLHLTSILMEGPNIRFRYTFHLLLYTSEGFVSRACHSHFHVQILGHEIRTELGRIHDLDSELALQAF